MTIAREEHLSTLDYQLTGQVRMDACCRNNRLKVAYVTTYNSSDIDAWSGTGYHMRTALESHGFETECIGDLRDPYMLWSRGKKLLYATTRFQTYLRDREPLTLRAYANQVENALISTHCDIVFSPSTIPIAYLRTDRPVVFWSDATFAGMIDFYSQFSKLCAETVKNGHKMEQLALSRSRLAIYSSEWAAYTAIKNYDVDPAKVKVVPFGANIRCDRAVSDIRRIIAKKDADVCRLLFIGVDWYRKGGDVALAVTRRLNDQGIKTELHIVGCYPDVEVPSYVKLYGFVSKKSERGRMLLDKLFTESHFLIVPSRAECFGVVYAEASSFGLPSLATDVGGIPSAVRNGVNGFAFALDEHPESYCEFIARTMSSPRAYEQLALSTFQEYEERLNWFSAGRSARDLIIEHCM